MKKWISSILAVVMLVSSIHITSFAEEETSSFKEQIPDVIANVTIYNEECTELDNLENLTMVITKKSDQSEVAKIPLAAYEDEDGELMKDSWSGMAVDAISADILDELAALQGDFDLEEMAAAENIDEINDFEEMNPLQILSEAEDEIVDILNGYEITIEGASKEHYTKIESTGIVVTPEIMESICSLMKELFGELLKEENPNYVVPDSFSQLFKDIMGYLEFTLEDLAFLLGIEIDETIWEELDAMIAFLCSEDYKGTLIIDTTMECECKHSVEYEVIHKYYKVCDGKKKLVGRANYGTENFYGEAYYVGLEGDLIKAADFINCEFNKETYKYIGSFEYFDGYELDEFVLSNEWDAPYGLILKYELEVSKDEFKNTVEIEDEDDYWGDDEEEPEDDSENKNPFEGNDKIEVDTPKKETAANTGDVNISLYVLLLMAAVSLITFVTNKRRI